MIRRPPISTPLYSSAASDVYKRQIPTKATPELDYYLYLAWLFTIVCALGYFAKSSYCERIIESIRNNWREAEIQHEHID